MRHLRQARTSLKGNRARHKQVRVGSASQTTASSTGSQTTAPSRGSQTKGCSQLWIRRAAAYARVFRVQTQRCVYTQIPGQLPRNIEVMLEKPSPMASPSIQPSSATSMQWHNHQCSHCWQHQCNGTTINAIAPSPIQLPSTTSMQWHHHQ